MIVGGRVDTVCFDKTGTLTEEGMTISGLILRADGKNTSNSIIKEIEWQELFPNRKSVDLNGNDKFALLKLL